MTNGASADGSGVTVIYDGECPFCSRYVAFLKLRDAVGPVRLVDARVGGDLIDTVVAQGFDLDDGMLLIMDGRHHHGADCINRLALMSTRRGWFNRLNAAVFRSPAMSRFLYPILRAGRNLTLALMGRRSLKPDRYGKRRP